MLQNILVLAVLCSGLMLHFCFSAPAGGRRSVDATTTSHYDPRDSDYAFGGAADSEIVENAPNDSSPTTQISSQLIWSAATGQFVAITKSGRVSGNNPIDRLVSQFYIMRYVENGRERLTIKSVRYSDRNWYLTINSRRKFRGDVPMNGNEVFEVETLTVGNGFFALRVVSPPYMNHSRSAMQNVSATATPSTNSSTNSTEAESSGSGSGSGSEDQSAVTGNVDDSTEQQDPEENGGNVATPPPCYLGFSSTDAKPACYDSSLYVEVQLQFRGAIPGL